MNELLSLFKEITSYTEELLHSERRLQLCAALVLTAVDAFSISCGCNLKKKGTRAFRNLTFVDKLD